MFYPFARTAHASQPPPPQRPTLQTNISPEYHFHTVTHSLSHYANIPAKPIQT
ncbi:hypothetical protein L873DRAFT_1813529 [Choiromyces venosus 120613-1]|uniref:Uncharacterized protein n=1 Tax=Choiromyces venosus 120613-1 TaxID=1336337 RepID=A0A3N4JEU5_9PEZI|nr:hypothetical protein L873DRAFT_1813529 [Choiromyces venosus 120613-1]